MNFPITRMRRYRKNSKIRDIVRETKLNKEDLIYPIFVKEDLKDGEKEAISTMPGEYRFSLNGAVEYAKELEAKGLRSIIVFGLPSEDKKDEIGSPAFASTGIVQRTVRKLKAETDLVIITDVCLCQYTSHGHCGLIRENDDTDFGYEILNDESLEYLAKTALSHAEAGADIVAPSDMMDGRIHALREILDENGYYNTMIMSYSVPYLDIIKTIREEFDLPLVTYNVSGEYSMIMAGIENGYLTEDSIMESLLSIKRAGADLIITNFAPYALDHL